MKMLFFIAALFIFSSTMAQNTEFFDAKEYLKKNKASIFQKQDSFFVTQPNKMTMSDLLLNMPEAKLSYTVTNKYNVYLLPQDKMPCIAPDMNQFQTMPNCYTKSNISESSIGQIPNAGSKVLIKPAVPYRK